MTNFERWKQSLTPEDIFANYGIFEFCSKMCPAKKYCITCRNPPHPDSFVLSKPCREIFYEWANKEAE